MKQINKLRSFLLGEPKIMLANDGNPVKQKVIQLGDIYFEIDFDVETGEPTGEFGWSKNPTMSHVPIREYYIAEQRKYD